MKRTDLIKLLHAIYTSVDTGVEENWRCVRLLIQQSLNLSTRSRTKYDHYWKFINNVNCKHYENLDNFTELFNECFPE